MLKKLGLGLSANDKYLRAYEKGVFLGDLERAVRLFQEAAEDYQKRGDAAGQARAEANATLYDYLHSGRLELLDILIPSLSELTEIEAIGSATETMPAGQLATELQARQLEAELLAQGQQGDARTLLGIHERAHARFEALGQATLVTYKHFGNDPFEASAERRSFLHAGKVAWFRARLKMMDDPAAAADEMSQALLFYRRAGYAQGETEAEQVLDNLRLQRTCWICGREMQAQGLNFEYLPTTLRPYHAALVEKARQDISSLALDQSRVAVCVVCRDLIANQARAIAQELVTRTTQSLAAQVRTLSEKVDELSRRPIR